MITTSVVLAAGQGTRMRSALPKVLHPLLGSPMVLYAVDTAQQVTGVKPVLIIGHGAQLIRQTLGDRAHYILQEPQLGTGHAVQQAESVLRGKTDLVLVTYADMPLLTASTLQRLIQEQQSRRSPFSMLTIMGGDARGFGRVVRDRQGEIQAVVEEAQAIPEQLEIREYNAGVYCFSADWLWGALKRVTLSPKGEYYLTDVVEIAAKDGFSVHAISLEDPREAIGINNRVHLFEAETVLRNRINQHWMLSGVTLVDPMRTYIEPHVRIGEDTVVWPDTYLQGQTEVGEQCVLGPNTIIRNTHIGDRCRVLASILEDAYVEDDVQIGPFGHLRKGTHLAKGVHMGNFGEVKNSYLGEGTKMGHFSYIGDATIGAGVNIGAGTITCNFDGEKKNPTKIGAGAFLGSDTMLVAPVTIGEGAKTGAGSVVTKDIPAHSLAVGAPARVIRKLEQRD